MTSKLPKIAVVAAPLIVPKTKAVAGRKVDAVTTAFHAWLDKHGRRELKAGNAFTREYALRPTYRGKFSGAVACAFRKSVAGVEDDGSWVARVRAA